ncbi:unnamed protein product, partial [Lymnaea stagnalis]
LISDETILYFRYVFLYFSGPAILVFGLGSNIFNMIVFTRMGLKDSVTLSLFSLAISDFCFLSISAMIRSALIVLLFPEVAPQSISLFDVAYASYWYSTVFFDTSMLIRVYTAVTRACCVAIPLTFKNTFTKTVTLYVMCAVFSVSIATRMPLLACQDFQSVFDRKTNTTRIVLYFTPLRPAALAVNDIFSKNIITWGSIGLVLTSLFVLKFKLVSAAKFRHGMKSGHATSEPNSRDKPSQPIIIQQRERKPQSKVSSLPTNEKSRSFLVGKDVQVLKVVILVSVIFIVCTFPQVVPSVVRRLVPEFNVGGRYGIVFEVVSIVFDNASFLNSSLNVFVYYSFNTNFRHVARRLFNMSMAGKN